MKTVQREGKNVEDIIAAFQSEQELSKEQVKYEIIDMGASGFLGLGRRKARVKFFLADEIEQVKEIVKDLLQHLQIYFVEIKVREDRYAYHIDIRFDQENAGLKEPTEELLFAMDHIIGRIVQVKVNHQKNTYIDINQFRFEKEKHLIEKAHSMAMKVVNEKQEICLPPMYPHDRRIVHLALNKNNDVHTYTVKGSGDKRSVVISLKNGQASHAQRRDGHHRGRQPQKRYSKRNQRKN